MTSSIHKVDAALRRMLLAYERLDAMWRIRYGLSADEKLVVLFLAEHAVLIGDLEAAIGIPMPDGPGLLERLEVRGFLRSVHGDAVALTKKGLSARLEFERTTRRIAEAGIDADGNAEAHHRFLEIASELAERRVHELRITG